MDVSADVSLRAERLNLLCRLSELAHYSPTLCYAECACAFIDEHAVGAVGFRFVYVRR